MVSSAVEVASSNGRRRGVSRRKVGGSLFARCTSRSGTTRSVGRLALPLLLFSITNSNRKRRRHHAVLVEATVACTSTSECVSSLRRGSECVDGECTNPFHSGGCLSNVMPPERRWTKMRVCHSEDPPGAAEAGICRPVDPGLDYTEVRISSQNWESAIFASWILQILLSEILGVPATIEPGDPDANLDFYDVCNAFRYGGSNDFDALRMAAEVGDCRDVDRSVIDGGGSAEYLSCAHVIPEVWNFGLDLDATRQQLKDDAVTEPPLALGAFGQNGFYMPRFTGERDPTLLTYLGLRGEENRQKLARTFKRPTTWGEYCEEVSMDGCETDDGVARRPPSDETERARMYVEGSYIGHFRETDKNNCTKHPDSCTGHVADFPCDWASLINPITYHLGIALESQSYPYSQLSEMWMAANATKSDIFMIWWTPEALHQSFLGSDAEFQKVSMPPPTYKCYENRIDPYVRCNTSTSLEENVGDPLGACDEAPQALQKLISTGLYSATFDPKIPEGRRSPAYDAVKLFTVTEVQLGKIYDYWLKRDVDRFNYDPREATCRWIAENFDFVSEFVPRTYPRVLREGQNSSVLFYLSIIFGILVTFLVLFSCYMTHRQRQRRVIRFAQIDFLWLLLAGLLLLSLGAIINAIPPTDATCVTVIWLINLGYTFELVPLIVKVAALNRLLGASRQMRRINLTRASLFQSVFILSALAIIYLIVWTVLDRPQKGAEYALTETKTDDGETVVTVTYYCESRTEIWWYISVGWNVVLLLCATVLAFQTRKLQYDFNESRTLAFMIYSHFIIVLIRVSTYIFGNNMAGEDLARLRSLIYSLDTMTTIFIYFFPKFFGRGRDRRRGSRVFAQATRAVARFVPDVTLFSLNSRAQSITLRPTAESNESPGGQKWTPPSASDENSETVLGLTNHAEDIEEFGEEKRFDQDRCTECGHLTRQKYSWRRRKSL